MGRKTTKKNKLAKKIGKQSYKKMFTAANSLSLQLYNSGRILAAEKASSDELRSNPNNPTALYICGQLSKRRGQLANASDFFARAVTVQPRFARAHFELGRTYYDLRIFGEAANSFRKTLTLGAKTPDVYNDLGNTFRELGETDKAIEHYKKALLVNHKYSKALDNLSLIFQLLGKYEEVATYCKRSIEMDNLNPVSHNSLAVALINIGNLQEAENVCVKALELNEDFAPHYTNLGSIYHKMGAETEAVSNFRKSLALQPAYDTHSILLFILNYLPNISQAEIYSESLRWDELYASPPLLDERSDDKNQGEGRRLKIGYLSPDFCDHPVSYFIEPVLRSHDREKVMVYCFANVENPDTVTQRLRSAVDIWYDIRGMEDTKVIELIKKSGIDILVDLAGHSQDNRLLVFTQRPAPVQLTWLGYPNTTGIKSIDYRLTDAIADPPGEADSLHNEELIRLPNGFLCYQPDPITPATRPSPCLRNGYITFGSFNNMSKVSTEVVLLWAKILNSVVDSRLFLKCSTFENFERIERYMKMFEAAGIADRVEILGRLPRKDDHLNLYRKIDIGLDPFPYNGTTTTFEALWMGVPVVTLRGQRHSGRVGASIMFHTDLEELVAESQEEYRTLAISLAHDVDKLAKLSNSLREKLKQSSLMDRRQFTKTLEGVYRRICLK
ncbi:MAG: tetratricopeptide repeat protein [Desulfobacteraceae bacterium]|nr:tetratricopeptide repeat protein [Desulfobacteraceae bacterium]